MSRRLIPAPTISGILPAGFRGSERATTVDDAVASLQRSQRTLERHLQELLDAQSFGLAAQVGQSDAPGAATATAASRPRVSLHQARRDILSAIRELATVKSVELNRIHGQFHKLDDVLDQAANWMQRRDCLRNDIDALNHEKEDADINALTEEDAMVQEQINAMEEKLSQLRSHQSDIRSRLSQLRNSKASKLSSYQSSMALLDSEVKQFLHKPLPDVLLEVSDASTLRNLPSKRRTLEMVTEQAQRGHHSLQERQQALEKDIDALKNGGTLWDDATQAIEVFEQQLRRATKELSPTGKSPKDPPLTRPSSSPADPAAMLSQMQAVRVSLEGLLQQAEEKGWTLLIAAIGAEVEAFRQGENLLQGLQAPGDDAIAGQSTATASSAGEIEDPSSLLLSQTQDDEEG